MPDQGQGDRPLAPFHALGIGAVCNIPRLRAHCDNVTNGSKARPSAPAAVVLPGQYRSTTVGTRLRHPSDVTGPRFVT